MAKTRRLMREALRLVDAVIELRDARIVKSSQNPEIDSIIKNKPRLILLNKCDLADESVTRRWCDY
jgi:ribosome biogenesis GTPase A